MREGIEAAVRELGSDREFAVNNARNNILPTHITTPAQI